MTEEDAKDSDSINNRAIVEEICKPFLLSDDTYQQIRDIFLDEIKKGLCKYTHEKAAVKCLLTFVEKLPSGCERGKYLALDVGGTNFRILLLDLHDGGDNLKLEIANYELPESLLTASGRELFDFLADCLYAFIYKYELQKDELSLGFTFSFPLKQTELSKGVLISWTKAFNCSGVVGHDVVDLLKEALNRKGDIQINNIVILNDTTGTLISCAWEHHEAKIGLIIGTGINECYLEKTKYIELFKGGVNASPTMVINCESGNFGNDGSLNFIRTPIDLAIDNDTVNPGKQVYEKMISGMYLGEIVRLILLECVNAGAMLKGGHSDQIRSPMSFDIKYMSQIEGEEPGNDDVARQIFDIMGYKRSTHEDCENLRYICDVISTRSANLVAATLATLVNRIGDPFVIIGVDGSVYRMYPNYAERLRKKLKELARPEYKFCIKLAEDGSGRGAALLAATAFFNKRNQ
uniref:Phosphotransferase n=1 Tax=Glossina brevipalpis TaxID=37001 RepID=A0A1A9WH75_9MUSC